MFHVLNNISFCHDGSYRLFKNLHIDNKTSIITELALYHMKFEAVMSESAGGTEQQTRYKSASGLAWKSWMSTPGLIQKMLNCRCASTVTSRIPHFTKNMQQQLDKLLLKEASTLLETERASIETLSCGAAKSVVVSVLVKEWKDMWVEGATFHDAPDQSLMRWCYNLWRVLGYQIASSMKKMQHWFQVNKAKWVAQSRMSTLESTHPSTTSTQTNEYKAKPTRRRPETPNAHNEKKKIKEDRNLLSIMSAKAMAGNLPAIQYMSAHYAQFSLEATNSSSLTTAKTKAAVTIAATSISARGSSQISRTSSLGLNAYPDPKVGEDWAYGDYEDLEHGLMARFVVLDGHPDTGGHAFKAQGLGTVVVRRALY